MRFKSHYDTLKVARDAPFSVIRAAYKTLAQQHHPDRKLNNAEAAELMSLLNQAYEILSNPEKRKQYDETLSREEVGTVPPRTSSPPPKQQPNSSSTSASKPPHAAGKKTSMGESASTLSSFASLIKPAAVICVLVFFILLFKLSFSLQHTTTQEPRNAYPHAPPNVAPTPTLASSTLTASASPPPIPFSTPTEPESSWLPDIGLTATVDTEQLNVRNGPGTKFDVIGKLAQGVPVVIRGNVQGSWVAILYGEGTGYVNKKLLRFQGRLSTVPPVDCQIERPPSGKILLKNSSGPHQLEVQAPFDNDVYVKLKNVSGQTILAGFVGQGQSFTFGGIPDGSYQAWFAMGTNFSTACRRFMTDMVATFDPNFQEYRSSVQGNYIYHQVMRYSLQLQRDGNFSTQTGSVNDFMSD
ncbi:hypothetical protein BOTU111921_19120 [Bordetella tumbae]|uniref:DnaJ domain-containing protein n=1 Tax=Bordetella tumbae TaxID=1649139 RepID=UPI0039F0FA7F